MTARLEILRAEGNPAYGDPKVAWDLIGTYIDAEGEVVTTEWLQRFPTRKAAKAALTHLKEVAR